MWTPDRDAELTRLWATSLSTRLIAEEMGSTKNAIVGRAHRIGLDRRKSPITNREGGPRPVALRKPKVTLALPVRAAQREPVVNHHRTCQWPLWGKEKPTHQYCGDPVRMRGPETFCVYCPAHAAVAFVPYRREVGA